MEPTTQVVLSQDFDLPTRQEHFDKDGKYRWPYGLLNNNAWKLLERPRLQDVSSRDFYINAAAGIVPLTDDEARKILALSKQQVELLRPVRALARIEGEDNARRSFSPPPATSRRRLMHLRAAPAFTYAMIIEGVSPSSFKIGWAFDYKARQRQFNKASLPFLGGLRYRTCFSRLWDTARQAFAMEQALLKYFEKKRRLENHEVIYGVSRDELQRAWIDYLK